MVADVGSGTGLLTRLFLEHGSRVFGIEPNDAMRGAGERQLASFEGFTSVAGTAEATTLPDGSVDLVVAGQAFHWFDRERARTEFVRILRSPRWVVLVWNERLTGSPFLAGYERILQTYSPDYAAVDHRRINDEVISEFFRPNPFQLTVFPNRQLFDFPALRGRLLSSSYAPQEGHPAHEPMLAGLTSLFKRHAVGGQVAFDYETKIYVGNL